MTINLTPAIQTQIYMDKKDGYLLNMLEKLTPKIDYVPEEKKTQTSNDKDEDKEKDGEEKKKPFFSDSVYGFNSYQHKQNLNKSISTESFFSTLSTSSGNVKEAS